MRYVGIVILVVLIAACAESRDPIIVSPLPTVPTATNTVPAPTATDPIPTSTPAPTIATTPTPIARDPNVSPTSPLGPTFTAAPPTLTRTPEPTTIGIDIEYFITNAELIAPGDNVTLFWQVFGAENVTIYSINSEGERENPRPVRDEGQITVSVDTDLQEIAQFVLVAEVGGIEAEELIEIEINCEGGWFFDPSPGGCPADEPVSGGHAQQTFENGLMIWSSLTNEIFIFYEDNNVPQWQRLPDNFQEGDQERDDTLIPPPNLIQPVRGFGLLWRSSPGVRDRLGWAIETEAGFESTLQSGTNAEGDEVLFIRQRNGNVLQLLPDGSDWQVIVPELTPESE